MYQILGDYMKNCTIKGLMLMSVFLPLSAVAQDPTFGSIVDHIVEGPVSLLIQFMYGISYLTGMFFLFKAYENFRGHMIRPETIPIVNVYFLSAFGITLILLPMIHHLIDKFY